MDKRGQLTIFLLLGLLVVIAVAFVLYLEQPGTQLFTPPQFDAQVSALHACFESETSDMMATQLGNGGLVTPLNAMVVPPLAVNIVVDQKGVNVPSVEDMQDDLALYLPKQYESCRLQVINQTGMAIDPAQIIVNATYTDAGLLVRVDAPFILRQGRSAFVLPEQLIDLHDTDVLPMRAAVEQIAQEVATDGGLPIRTFIQLPYAFSTLNVGYGESIVSMQSNDTLFNFAVREPMRDSVPAVTLNIPEQFLAHAGQLNQYSIDMQGINAVTTDLPWVAISPTGDVIIDGIGQTPGSYVTEVSAIDYGGKENTAMVRVVLS